jgi:ankyrin repeat protein
MKNILITTIAAVLVVGCSESQQSAPSPETKPAAEPVAETAQPEPPTATPTQSELAEAELENRGWPRGKDNWNGDLELAADQGVMNIVKLLLAAGVDVDAKGETGRTPLWSACYQKKVAVAELLIAEGADVNAKNKEGWTPLHSAARFDFTALAKSLIDKGADVNAKDDSGWTPLYWAVNYEERGPHTAMANLLRKNGARF